MFKIGDKVKWNGKNFGIAMPYFLTEEMVGTITGIMGGRYPYEVEFLEGVDTFMEEELDLA